MKKPKLLKYGAAILALFVATSCNDEKYTTIENGVYIEEAAPSNQYNQQVSSLTVEEEMTKTLTVRLANYIDQDVKVTLDIDNDFIASYNEANGTSYQVLPKEYLSFDKSVVIPTGEVSAPLANIHIKPFSTPNGETYAIPIKLSSVEGPVSVIGNASHIMYLLSAPHRQTTPILKYGDLIKKEFASRIPTSTWTLEYWFRMNAPYAGANNETVFTGNTSPITFNAGDNVSEMFIRFWPNGALNIGPCYQFQMKGAYFDDNTEAWKADTWYHVAYTYDGTTVQLYIDGVANASKDVSINFEFSNIQLAAFSGGRNAAQLAQIRIWNYCLPQSSIQDAMNREVAANSEGLIGYWKCSEGEGTVLHDSSINGNDITFSKAITWSEEYNFMHPNE